MAGLVPMGKFNLYSIVDDISIRTYANYIDTVRAIEWKL